ncbi:xanthine dehydrogenase-like [Anticarsia gemmatalis]|uniref:xanthine dehydrogenase-like n=1 Tax=Anticarsia gemmatalis TaxID=129554 RepID=UPI003F76F99A
MDMNSLVPKDVQKTLLFFVNGKKVIEPNPDPEWTLLWYLRKKLLLTGTKYGCGEGGCGACTVMVSEYLRTEDRVKHIAVNACLTPVCAMHGLAVTTVEGIGSTQDRLHPVQERIAKAHGSQCGFCTPGIVMSMYALLRNKCEIKYSDIETALQGNLCRCTGYRPIIEGFKTFTDGWEKYYSHEGENKTNGLCAMGKECCRNKEDKDSSKLFNKSLFQPFDPTQEPIFPPELKLNPRYSEECLYFQGENVTWIRPKTLEDLLRIKSQYPTAKLVAGNSEIGVEMKFKKKVYPILLYPSIITEMNLCSVSTNGVSIGATTTLTELADFLEDQIVKNPIRGKVFEAIKYMLHWFAGNQVRNVATLVGNIVTASPISDLNPILMACSAVLNVYSANRGQRTIAIDETFFKGYRSTTISEDEVVVSIDIPFTESLQYFMAYKQARRKEDDISIVTSAFNVKFDQSSKTILQAKLCYGGMGPTTICAHKTSKILVGQQWNQSMLNIAFTSLTDELHLDSSVPGGMAEYRKSLCLSLFFRFYLYVLERVHVPNGIKLYNERDLSATTEISAKEPTSSQYYEIKNDKRTVSDAVGLPITHLSALKQATGEALYCDDIPPVEKELHLKLIFSSEAHAKIKSIDASEALKIPGVEGFFSAADLDEECNKMGPIIKDEEIFSSQLVTSRACVVGAIVATTESIARKARDLVIINYEPLQPVIVTLEDAISQKSFFPGYPRVLRKGDVDKALLESSHIAEGYVRNGAQEHFYLETMSAYAIRKEDELEIVATTQNPEDIAHIASETLKVPNHKVVAKVKRVGGGFGGKETRAAILAIPVAIAAYKLKKPVRAVLDRDEDMQVTGYRHPCLVKYKVGFNNEGKINGAKFEIYSNAGNSMDISCSMIERALVHVDNCYNIPNIQVVGYLCRTNMPSNTAFRGFGAPKAMLAAETMIRHIAETLNKSYEEIVQINLYQEGALTHFNQTLTYCTLSRCWNECIETSDYWNRKKAVDDFNRRNRWKKKGITLVPTKYGISFQVDVLMQAGALLLVYKDGSVLLSIGGIEMGQGLFTKMVQVASRALGVDYTKIHISEMSTDKVPNSSPTAGSISSDLYGMAVLEACNILKKRLEPFKAKKPNGKWEDWVIDAYVNRVQLSATGFYASPKIEYNPETNTGNLFEYFTYGVACSEVIIDCLTGDHQVLRTDIVMDVGESLNPAIDIGQIEGAFMQGYGFYTLEEMVFSDRGEALSRGPGTYKIPGFSDIPKVFNVSLLKGAPNPRAVYSSKAVGEPPLFLAASVFFAIKEAIKAARLDGGVSADFTMDSPATCARIRMACEDHITKQVKPTITNKRKPWNVIA